MGLLLNGAGDLVIKDIIKVKLRNAFFASVFTGKVCSQVPEPASAVWGSETVAQYRKKELGST